MKISRLLLSSALLLGGCDLLWSTFQETNPAFCDPATPGCTLITPDGGTLADAAMADPDAATDDGGPVDAAMRDGAQNPDLLCNPGTPSVWVADPPPGASAVSLTGITGNGTGDVWTVGNPTYAAHHAVGWNTIGMSGITSVGRAAYAPKQNQVLAVGTNLLGSVAAHLSPTAMVTADQLALLLTGLPTGIWISAAPENRPYVVGVDSTFKSYDGSWSDVVLLGLTPNVLNDISGTGLSATTVVWGVSPAANRLLAFSGTTWKSISTSATSLNAVWASTVSGVVAVGDNGAIVNVPAVVPIGTPVLVNSPVTADLLDVGGTADGTHLWAVGKGGTIVHWESACRKWTQESSLTTKDLSALWVSDAEKTVWAVGANGTVLHRSIP